MKLAEWPYVARENKIWKKISQSLELFGWLDPRYIYLPMSCFIFYIFLINIKFRNICVHFSFMPVVKIDAEHFPT